MADPTGDSPVALRQTRERTIQALSRNFADDLLDITEFEARLDRAWRASTLDELRRLTADLPAAPPVPAAPKPAPVPVRPGGQPVRAMRRFVGAVMGGVSRKGQWHPPSKLFAYAFWGGVDLDFREAVLGPGVTEVQAFAIMGGIDIVVPPDLPVEVDGFAFMGGFDQAEQRPPEPGKPLLRITGLAVMGGVDVRVRIAGETESDYRRRRREERKALRGGHS